MSTAALAASIALGAVFVLAGASKLAAGANWPTQARGLDAPGWSIPLVPWLELAVGASLIVRIGGRVPIFAALVLLVAFTAALLRKLAAGEHPPCACFGAWTPKPIGPLQVARNAALIAVGLLALV